MTYALRIAQEHDVPALAALIPQSVRALQAAHYSTAQMDAAIGPVFGVDRELIRDGTYFVVEFDQVIVGCGGWSNRRSSSAATPGARPTKARCSTPNTTPPGSAPSSCTRRMRGGA